MKKHKKDRTADEKKQIQWECENRKAQLKNLGGKNASQISFVSNLRLEFPFSLGTSICMKTESHLKNKTAHRFEITRQKDVQMPCSLHTPAFQGFSLSSLCLFSLATQAVGCPVFRYMYTIPLTLVPLTRMGRIDFCSTF